MRNESASQRSFPPKSLRRNLGPSTPPHAEATLFAHVDTNFASGAHADLRSSTEASGSSQDAQTAAPKMRSPGRNDERCLPGTELNQHAEHQRRQGAAEYCRPCSSCRKQCRSTCRQRPWERPRMDRSCIRERTSRRSDSTRRCRRLRQRHRNGEKQTQPNSPTIATERRASLVFPVLCKQPVRRQPADGVAETPANNGRDAEQADLQEREMPGSPPDRRQPAQGRSRGNTHR